MRSRTKAKRNEPRCFTIGNARRRARRLVHRATAAPFQTEALEERRLLAAIVENSPGADTLSNADSSASYSITYYVKVGTTLTTNAMNGVLAFDPNNGNNYSSLANGLYSDYATNGIVGSFVPSPLNEVSTPSEGLLAGGTINADGSFSYTAPSSPGTTSFTAYAIPSNNPSINAVSDASPAVEVRSSIQSTVKATNKKGPKPPPNVPVSPVTSPISYGSQLAADETINVVFVIDDGTSSMDTTTGPPTPAVSVPVVTFEPQSVDSNAFPATFTAAAAQFPAGDTVAEQWFDGSSHALSTFTTLDPDPSTGVYTAPALNLTSTPGGNQVYAEFFDQTNGLLLQTAPAIVGVQLVSGPSLGINHDLSVAPGSQVSLTSVAAGPSDSTVKWEVAQFDENTDYPVSTFTAIPGPAAKLSTYTFAATADVVATATVQNSDGVTIENPNDILGNEYDAVFSDLAGDTVPSVENATDSEPGPDADVGDDAIVDAPADAPVITLQPQNLTVAAGQDATLTAAASGIPTPSVQWMMEVPGATAFSPVTAVSSTSTTLDLGAATLAESGTMYEAVFSSGTLPEATTNAVTLTVTASTPPTSSGGSLVGSASTAAPSYNLTALGTTDWAHWGIGGNVNASEDKATGGTQITNLTRVGTGGSAGFGGYSDSSRDVSWTDGTPPVTSDAGDEGYIWANNANGAGYSFTVPASATAQTIDVYLGGYSSAGTLTATLSDSSASPYSVSFSGTAHYSNVVAITYTAASAGQHLTLQYVKSGLAGTDGAAGSVDLIAAWLAPASQPNIIVSPISKTVAAGSTVTFTASASGAPVPSVQWLQSTDGGTTFSAIPGATSTTYSFTSTASQNGDEFEAEFTNIEGYAQTSPATLTVTAASTGVLNGVVSTAGASYNLTALGTTDWAHWGIGGNVNASENKKTGGTQINNLTRIGTGGFGGYSDPSRDVSWTDGTPPVASDPGDEGYIWANNAIGAGYSFTVPASTATHTLYVYLGGYSSQGTFTAHLSNSSAPDYSVSIQNATHYSDVIALTFDAGSSAQTLTLKYLKSQNFGSDGNGGSVDLIAAWLV